MNKISITIFLLHSTHEYNCFPCSGFFVSASVHDFGRSNLLKRFSRSNDADIFAIAARFGKQCKLLIGIIIIIIVIIITMYMILYRKIDNVDLNNRSVLFFRYQNC